MSAKDMAISLAKGLAATNPLLSGIVNVVNEYEMKALKVVVQQWGRRVESLERRLDFSRMASAEFVDLFKNCCIIIRRTQHTEKLRAAANILTNALLQEGDQDKLKYTELDHFTHCVENLSIGAIQVLRAAFERAKLKRHGHKPDRLNTENVRLDVGELQSCLTDIDANLLMGLIGELNAMHLLHSCGVPGVRMGEKQLYNNYPLETTPLGYRFIEHILGQNTPVD